MRGGQREESARDIIGEETGDSWLREVSESKARSRTPKRVDATLEERALVTNVPVIQGDDDRRKNKAATSMYLRPTTMRGIPLVSLTSSPLMRGFYVTRSEDDPPSSTLAVDFASPYTTIDSPIERQTETASTPDISTTDETVIVTHNNRDELKFDNNINELELDINNINKSKDVDNHEEKLPTFDSSENSSENPSNYTELDTVRIPVGRSTSKREKLLLNFDYNTTPFSNVSPTTSTKRRIAIALSKYNEASIPLWTGKRIVPRKRNRTAVSSIKEAERRIDETDFPRTTKSVFKNVSATSEISSTISSIVPESTSPGILDVYSDFAYSTDSSKTEDSKNHTNAKTAVLTNSVTTAAPSISKIKNDFTATVTSTISDDFISVTTMPATANESIIMTTPSSTIEVAKVPVITSDRITTKSVTKGVEIEIPLSMTANYSAADVSTTTNTHAIANDSVIIPATTSAGVEITSPIANYSTDFTNTIIPATVSAQVKITNYSVTAVPINTSTNAIVSDSDVVTTAPAITIGTGIETTPTTNTHEIDIDSTVVTTTNEIETTITDHPAFVISTNTVIPDTSTIISPTYATIPATTSNLVDVDSITVTNMPITTIPTTVITPTIDDSNVITSVNASVSSITDISTTTSLPETSSAIFVTSAGETSRNSSAVPTTLTVESTTTHFNLNVFNISNNSEVSAVTTAKSIQTTEIPTTFETSSIFTSTVTSRSLPSINFTMSSTPSTLFSIANVEKSTLSAIHDESTATNTIIQTTGTYNPSSVQTTSEKSTTPKIKITSEEAVSRTIQRKQDQTSKLDDQIGQKTPRRRVLNRKNNWLGRPVVQQTVNQYPRHRVILHRGRPQRPPGYTSRVIETNLRRRVMQRRTRVNFASISSTIKPEESTVVVQNTTENHVADNRARNLRRKIVSRVRKNFQGNFSTNFVANKNFSDKGRTGRRIRVLLKRIRSKSEENNFTIPKTSANIINENLQSNLSNNLSTSKNLSHKQKPGRRMRIVLKRVRPKFEEEEKVKIEEASRDSRDESLQDAFSNNFRSAKNVLTKTRRKVKIVLKSIKPKSEEKNSTAKEMDSDSADEEDLQGSFSSNIYTSVNLFDEEGTRKSIKSEKKDSVAEETMHSDFTDKNFSSNLHAGDNREKMITHFKYGRKEATIERPEDPEELQTTETFALAEENTDQPSLEVNSLKNGGYISRKSGHSNIIRQRKPIRNHSTTAAPLINSFPSTVAIYRSGRPVETTFSSRIDLVDAVEDTRPISMQNDQRADVSDQSIRAQEFAVALADPPLSSSDTGRTASRDATIRKISTTVAPRTDPTIYRTISRYNEDFRNRQRPKTKSARPTANATTRPRRPPVLDYDYYEDEVPIVVAGTSVLNSKLFLTSKGTIRCLDQGNFPHPYSCKKFITCARMVNGQVIGTEYTCPDKLTFDPIGGICNWSVGLCTDRNSY